MPAPDDITLTPAFAAVAATGLDIETLSEVETAVERVPRLEVPIDVQALRVADGETIEHAEISTGAILDAATRPIDSVDPAQVTAPDPFSDLDPRKPGIYVHWAVPDALLQAEVESEDESSVRPESEITFPALPNRWCLTRFWWAGGRYRHTSWVIEADRGRTVPLEAWKEVAEPPSDGSAATPEVGPADLTAVLGGDAAWFAVFDNVERRFAFRDELADVQGGPPDLLHYTVIGWYSDRSLDPIAGSFLLAGFEERLAELGWAADTSTLQEAAKLYDRWHTQIAHVELLRGEEPKLTNGLVDVSSAQKTPPLMFEGADVVIPAQRVYWPQQSLFYGTIYNVAPRDGVDAKPPADTVEVGVGGTTTEALSSLMAESLNEVEEAAREQLLNALQYGLMDQIETADGPAQLAAESHRRTFESQPGGFTTERIRAGDPFAHLQTPVDAGGVRTSPFDDIVDTKVEFESAGVVFEMIQGSPDYTGTVHEGFRPVDEPRFGVGDVGTVRGGGSGPGGSFLEVPPLEEIPPAIARPPGGIDISDAIDETRELVDAFTLPDRPLQSPRAQDGIEYRTVKRALPRLFYPQDPAVSIRGAGRSLRFRGSTNLDEEGRLMCRLSGAEVRKFPGLVSGEEALADRVFTAHIPFEAQALLEEAALHVLGGSANLATVAKESTVADDALAAAVDARLAGEDRLFERYLVPGSQTSDLFIDSTRLGTLPSPKGITAWRQPWEPTYLEWEVVIELDRRREQWRLADIDLVPIERFAPDHTTLLKGRSLLSSSASTSISELLAAFIDEEENLDAGENTTGVIGDDALDDLQGLNADAKYADILSGSFDGVRDHLLGFSTNVRLTDAGEDGEIVPDRLPELLRAGFATIEQLRIVDAFGRFLELKSTISIADDVEVVDANGNDHPSTFLLPPRILAPSRLWFRFVDATDDERDALIDQETKTLVRSPIAGWLLPDHVDGALEVFDPAGEPLGQLRNERLGGGVVWEGAPGAPGPMGRAPFHDIADRHTSELARVMIERDVAEREASNDYGESTLDAFMRAVDTTLWTVDPFADSGLDYYSKMTGRPIAVVRARLMLDVIPDYGIFGEDDPRHRDRRGVYDELSRRKFEVRLGSLARIDDGLLGYFVNDDYRRFHPVHVSVPSEAIPSARNTGFLGSVTEAADFDPTVPKPIEHPYVVPNPRLEVQPGHPVRLTLLVDPGTRIHATTGIVPRKAIGIPRGFVESALARIAPSFRFGPLLVDPAVIRMPKPSVLPEEQVWTRRDSPTTWRDDPIEAATQFAYLPDTAHEAQEGYVRVRLDP